RLFLADALRNMGRGRFTQFAGDLRDVLGAVGFDRTYAAVAGYSEEELELQINQGSERTPVLGQTVLDDATAFVAGVNAYLAEAPVSTRRRSPYPGGSARQVAPAAVALLDPGSFAAAHPVAITGGATATATPVPRGMSNWLAVTGRKAAGGAPILVGGPQVGYFAPEVLLELALDGGGVNVRGALVPGTPYVVLGHTPDYAFTATAGGSDLADVRVERLCTPPGGAADSGTLYRGECRSLSRRVDTWTSGTATVTATIERTVHGPVLGRAMVDGQPVVVAVERSSFNREVESAGAFVQLNDDLATTPAAFRDVMASVNSTLNWLYVNRTDVAYFHSGL